MTPTDITGPLTLRRACEVIGWLGPAGKPTRSHIRSLRRRLAAAGKARGEDLVHGGGRQGGKCWTTLRVLIELRLLTEQPQLYGAVVEGMGQLHERDDALEAKLDALATEVFDGQARLLKVERRVAGLR